MIYVHEGAVITAQISGLLQWDSLSETSAWSCNQAILIVAGVGEGEAAIELVKSKTEAK